MFRYSRLLAVVVVAVVFLHLASASFADPVRADQAQKAAATFLKAQQARYEASRDRAPKAITRIQGAPEALANNIREIQASDGTILAYVVELTPEGFVILSADTDIRPILGYSFTGAFPFEEDGQNVLLHLVKWDVRARLRVLASAQGTGHKDVVRALARKDRSLWRDYESDTLSVTKTITAAAQWPPDREGWMETNWSQTGIYIDRPYPDPPIRFNDRCPYDPRYRDFSGEYYRRCYVGCVATAMAQILNYWKYPTTIPFDESDAYESGGGLLGTLFGHPNIDIDGDSDKLDFPTLAEMDAYCSELTYDAEIQPLYPLYLSFAVGIKTGMNYSSTTGSGTSIGPGDYLNGVGYGSATVSGPGWLYDRLRDNMKRGWPAQLQIRGFPEIWRAHSIVVDGYKDSGEFHLNLGWPDRWEDSWYFLPDDLPDIGDGYKLVDSVILDICPYQGWNQVGGDGNNSFRTLYAVPSTEPQEKWGVPVPANLNRYKYQAMVVGTGGKIYASLSPMDLAQGNPPYVAVINPYGWIEKLIRIDGSDLGIDYLAQDSRGRIFFGSSDTRTKTTVYRVDPRTDSVDEVLVHTSPDGGSLQEPIKIDKDDNIYFVIEAGLGLSPKVYCLSRSGAIRWTHLLGSDAETIRTWVAVDDERNQVYVNYYDSTSRRSKLVCFRRGSFGINWTHTFPGTHGPAEMAGPAGIGPDGTVYVGCFTTMYALSPENGSERWQRDFYPSYVFGKGHRAIGSDGTLYLAHGRLIGGVWHPGYVTVLAASNGAIKWQREIFQPAGTGDDPHEIYVGSNGVIAYTYFHKRDQANSWYTAGLNLDGEVLWQVQYGGRMAFGPKWTIYVMPGEEGAEIHALSVGKRGDPDELGEGYFDNSPPASVVNPIPADGSENLGSVVELSWTCTDPDGHDLKYDVFLGDATAVMVQVANV